MPNTVLIAQPYIPKYRVPFFKGLIASLARAGLRLEIAVSRTHSPNADASSGIPAWRIRDQLSDFTGGRAHYRSQLLRRCEDPDVAMVIVAQAAKYLDVLPLLMRRKHPVGIWGHGGSYRNTRRLSARIRLEMSRRCDQFFVYTPAGRHFLVDHGVAAERVTVVHNTIDTAALDRELRGVEAADLVRFRAEHGLVKGRTALYLGRVDAAKDIDFLLESAASAEAIRPGFTLLVGGQGDRSSTVTNAQLSGLPVRHLGRLDDHSKALAMAASDIMMIPSWIGLVAVDSLVAGLPIVTRDNGTHCPESEYLHRSTQSLWMPANTTPQEYGRNAAALLGSPELESMQRACRDAGALHRMSQMVEAFQSGILSCLERVSPSR